MVLTPAPRRRFLEGRRRNTAYNLAVIHQYGDGVPKSPAEALKWYRVAAEKGDRESQSRLGAMYLNGEGTAKNEKEGWCAGSTNTGWRTSTPTTIRKCRLGANRRRN